MALIADRKLSYQQLLKPHFIMLHYIANTWLLHCLTCYLKSICWWKA